MLQYKNWLGQKKKLGQHIVWVAINQKSGERLYAFTLKKIIARINA